LGDPNPIHPSCETTIRTDSGKDDTNVKNER
jgi:hypothetical protein